jgi:hypothetical protein
LCPALSRVSYRGRLPAKTFACYCDYSRSENSRKLLSMPKCGNFNATNWIDFQQNLIINYSTISKIFILRCFEVLLCAFVASRLRWIDFWVNGSLMIERSRDRISSESIFFLFNFFNVNNASYDPTSVGVRVQIPCRVTRPGGEHSGNWAAGRGCRKCEIVKSFAIGWATVIDMSVTKTSFSASYLPKCFRITL